MLTNYALYALAQAPREFDVVLADNLFGDLISDMIGTYAGSLSMLPSATLANSAHCGKRVAPGVYEPTHGSAPDIAGKGIAHPIGTILSVAMMFDYAFLCSDISQTIHRAVQRTLEDGVMTPDLGGKSGTQEITDKIIVNLDREYNASPRQAEGLHPRSA